MKIIRFFNDRVKRLNLFDLKLSQGIGIFAALILAKIFPEITGIEIWWLVAGMILCMIRPLYVLFLKPH